MIENQIFYTGLSRVELQTLRCRFPISFQFIPFSVEDLENDEKAMFIVSNAWCVFVNPKKLTVEQLEILTDIHKVATQCTHAALLLFTQPFTREQRKWLETDNLNRIDLCSRFDRPVRDAEEIVRKATMPCWNGLNRMKANGFNDGWYLLDFETTGRDPLEDDILSVSIAYMANYQIWEVEKYYIQQNDPISEELEIELGITNEMLGSGITKEELVEYLQNLPHEAPIIIASEKYDLPFLKALFHFCGHKFDLPFIAVDGLAAIVFCHLWCRRGLDNLKYIVERKYPRTPIDDPYLAALYDLTLAVFENLRDRYDVRCPGHFHTLYAAKILCGN